VTWSGPGADFLEYTCMVDWTSVNEIGWLYGKERSMELVNEMDFFSSWALKARKSAS